VQRIAEVRQFLHEINLGATAIGTTVTAAPGYPELATKYLSELTGTTLHPGRRPDRGDLRHRRLRAAVGRAQAHLGQAHQDLQRHPPAGLGAALRLQRDQPAADAAGLSIMPGKVNPVIPEVVNQTSFLVIGLDLTVTLAASAGQLQLNVMEPVITFALFTSIATMENAVNSLRVNCVQGITANAERTRDMVLNSLGIVTVLKPLAGLQAVRRDRARGLRDRQVAAPDRGGRAQADDAGALGRGVLVREPDQPRSSSNELSPGGAPPNQRRRKMTSPSFCNFWSCWRPSGWARVPRASVWACGARSA
jgi:aspartate ammonia-lyase